MTADELTLAVIAERLKSLRDISERDFREIKEQIADMRNLPARVSKLEAVVANAVQDIDDMRESAGRGVEFRRGQLPMLLLTALVVLVGIGQGLTAVFH